MTNRSITFRSTALSDLDGIADYTLQTFGTLSLVRYLDDLQRCFTIISTHPEIGVSFAPNVRRFAIGQHWIYYSHSQKAVQIIRILPQKTIQILGEAQFAYGPQTKELSNLAQGTEISINC
jgi:plasmid stabilization system protein ParE